ncbi:MAG: tyrosine-type recombinase/integrase [bacterium]|nr:tyrosine-type recombinase/integrase [bacterium]
MSLLLSVEQVHFFKSCKSEGKRKGTLKHYDLALRRFAQFLDKEGINDLRDVSIKTAEMYVSFILALTHYKTGEDLSVSSQNHLLAGVRFLYRKLYLEEKILINPFEGIHLKKTAKILPRDILCEDEMERLLHALKTRYGLFGETVGELFYGTGIRAEELVNLILKDVNLADHILFIREGKGGKDRVIPIPSGVVRVCRRYRKNLKPGKYFFETQPGHKVSSNWIRKMLHQAAKDSSIEKKVTPHGIRHTFATHLLQRGMDIRYIQMLLGHDDISTTEIYTQIRNEELVKVYRRSHPRA